MPVGVGLDENPNNWHTFILSTSHILLFCEDFQIYFKWATLSNYPPSGCLEDPFWVWVGSNQKLPDFLRFQIPDINPPVLTCWVVPQEFRASRKWVGTESFSGQHQSQSCQSERLNVLKKWSGSKQSSERWITRRLFARSGFACGATNHQPTHHFSCVKHDQWCRGRENQTGSEFQIDICCVKCFVNTWQSLQNLTEKQNLHK